jgi:peptide/nickel transport system permease protein
MLETLGQNYIQTARAKGLRETVVVYKHALKNAALPVVTTPGLQAGS